MRLQAKLTDEHDIVLVVRDPSGARTDQIAPGQRTAHLAAVLPPVPTADAVLCTEGSAALARPALRERQARSRARDAQRVCAAVHRGCVVHPDCPAGRDGRAPQRAAAAARCAPTGAPGATLGHA